MKRLLISGGFLLVIGVFLFFALGTSNSNNVQGTYKIELDNAFGLVSGADFKVAGVRAGTIQSIDLPKGCINGNPAACYALVTVQVTQSGFGQFRSDAFCQSRPQSLIGEYFIECQPGTNGKVLPPGSTIPVTQTQSTIPGDLLQNVMRMPYRQRFSLIINELGAAVAARSDDLKAALQRAVPALTQTDNLLNLLANDSKTLQALTADSNSVITALANNSTQVQRFITEANNTSTATATQDANLQATFAKFPGFLQQLRPAMQKLGAAADSNTPVLQNLNAASSQLNRFFTNLPGFAHASLPALKSLGQASITGKQAVQAAGPAIKNLNTFAKPTPELAQNLSIVLQDLDNRARAVEADSRSPGGKGYTGLEALLQYVFNQTLAINGFSQFGHYLTVDAFIDPRCAQYATPQSVAKGLATYGAAYRQCYAWLGPNQPGVNTTDPSNPTACVPDPGGAPPGEKGPVTTACKLAGAADTTKKTTRTPRARHATHASDPQASGTDPSRSSGSSSASPTSTGSSLPSGLGLTQTLGQIVGALGAGSTASSSSGSQSSAPNAQNGNQAQQLLSYLLAP